MINKKMETEHRLQTIDNQIHYMRQVSKRSKAPIELRESAQKSLESLEKERDDLLKQL
jgi:uncharacterized protein (UPF0147 family)